MPLAGRDAACRVLVLSACSREFDTERYRHGLGQYATEKQALIKYMRVLTFVWFSSPKSHWPIATHGSRNELTTAPCPSIPAAR